MSFPSQVRSIENLQGPAGRLEAILNTGAPDSPYTALIAHPHPPSGGTMHNKVVYHAMKTFTHLGVPSLRFNFRGTGLSEGVYDMGRGEVDDVKAALHWLHAYFGKPVLFTGFSFGSNMGFRACCGDDRVAGLCALGLPIRADGRDYRYSFLPGCTQPKLFISGDDDVFCPIPVLDELLETAGQPWERHVVEGADHFFQGVAGSPKAKLDVMQGHLKTWLEERFGLTEHAG